jgi:AbrB family looped-hinge helix DNA binding protein
MTFGLTVPAPERKLVRIQEKGQVTLPVEVRRRLGLKKGDLVAVTETDDGILISPQQVVAMKALDRVGELLREQGVDLDEMITSGRQIRGELINEEYGIGPDTPTS